jgi:hypothetical protein
MAEAPQGPSSATGETVDEFLFERLGFVQMYARIAQTYIEAGDRVGLNYSMRQLIAQVKATAGVLNDLREQANK